MDHYLLHRLYTADAPVNLQTLPIIWA